MKGKKRIIALLLCVLTLVGLMPTAAFAAEKNVTIESQTNSAFDYLQYYSEGGWHDLNTPKHTIEQTGEVAYCVEHKLQAHLRVCTPSSCTAIPATHLRVLPQMKRDRLLQMRFASGSLNRAKVLPTTLRIVKLTPTRSARRTAMNTSSNGRMNCWKKQEQALCLPTGSP